MSSLRIGRLLVGPPLQWQEMTGDPLTNVGGAVIADTRTPLSYQVQVGTYAADGEPDTPADRLRIPPAAAVAAEQHAAEDAGVPVCRLLR